METKETKTILPACPDFKKIESLEKKDEWKKKSDDMAMLYYIASMNHRWTSSFEDNQKDVVQNIEVKPANTKYKNVVRVLFLLSLIILVLYFR